MITKQVNNSVNVHGRSVVMLMTKNRPEGKGYFMGNDRKMKTFIKFEARVLIQIGIDKIPKSRSHFRLKRMVQHGNGFNKWWEQEREDKIMIQHDAQYLVKNDIDDELPMLDLDCYYYVVVYVKSEEVCIEDYKLDMHHSIGGQCKVFCSCHNGGVQNPLILTS